jgi:hypothetical protein
MSLHSEDTHHKHGSYEVLRSMGGVTLLGSSKSCHCSARPRLSHLDHLYSVTIATIGGGGADEETRYWYIFTYLIGFRVKYK